MKFTIANVELRTPQEVLDMCNAQLEDLFKNSLQVYRLSNGMIVSPNPVPGVEITYEGSVAITHTGTLVNIKERR